MVSLLLCKSSGELFALPYILMQLEGVNLCSVSEEMLWMLREGAEGLHLFAAVGLYLFAAAREWSFICARHSDLVDSRS